MKITECHITNFGKLSDKTFIFKDGLNALYEDNGFGKSTLAMFIKVMFFGFDNEKKKNDFDNERRRFAPWQGGAYGGSIKFEAGGKEFLLERVFGKTKKGDSFSLRGAKTNLADDTYSENIGAELFKIDSESFMRTVFISQSDCETETNGSINAKLTNLAENTDDINNYENADKALNKILNNTSPERSTGRLYQIKAGMTELKEDIKGGAELNRLADEAAAERGELLKAAEDIRREDEILKKDEAAARAYKDTQIKREKYESLSDEFEKRIAEFKESAAYFKHGIPAADDLTKVAAECGALAEKNVERNLYELSGKEQEELASLDKLFFGNPPSEAEIRAAADKQKTAAELELKAARHTLSPAEETEIRDYAELFKNLPEDEREIDSHISLWNKRNEKKSFLMSKKTSYDMRRALLDTNQKSNRKRGNIWLLAAAVILILCAAALMIISKPAFAAAAAVLGIAAAVVWVVTGNGKKNEANPELTSELEALKAEIDTDEEYIKDAEDKTRVFLAGYGAEYDDAAVPEELNSLKIKTRAYRSLLRKREEYERTADDSTLKSLKSDVYAFIAGIFPGADSARADEYLRKIEDGANRFRELAEKRGHFEKCRRESEYLSENIGAFFKKYGFEPSDKAKEQIDGIKSRLADYEIREREYKSAKSRKEQFEAENAELLSKLEAAEEEHKSLEELAAEREGLNERLNENLSRADEIKRHLAELNEAKDEIEDKKTELAELGEKYDSLMRKNEIVSLTRDYLKRAKEAFTARYTDPIMTGFGKYYGIVSGGAERFHMDANIKMTVDEAGMQREVKFFSSGTRSLIGICMRMALVEAMYDEEKPMLILDDPFVFLDGNHFKAANTLLDEIAKEYQVLYFTCGGR